MGWANRAGARFNVLVESFLFSRFLLTIKGVRDGFVLQGDLKFLHVETLASSLSTLLSLLGVQV